SMGRVRVSRPRVRSRIVLANQRWVAMRSSAVGRLRPCHAVISRATVPSMGWVASMSRAYSVNQCAPSRLHPPAPSAALAGYPPPPTIPFSACSRIKEGDRLSVLLFLFRDPRRQIAVHVIAHVVSPRRPSFQNDEDHNAHGGQHQRANPIRHADEVGEDEAGPALAEERFVDRGLGVQKGHRSEQTADEGEPCVAITGADLCQRRAWTGARQRDAGAEQQPANSIRGPGRGPGLQLHIAKAVEYRERDRARCDCGQKNLEHDEISQLHLSHNHARLEHTRFFECEAKHDAHSDAAGNSEREGHETPPLAQMRRNTSVAVAMPPANMAATATVDPTANCATPDNPWPLVQPSAIRAPNSMMKPPTKATTQRLAGDDEPSARCQIGEIGWRLAPDSRIDMNAPMAMPTTSATCHQFLAVAVT